MHQRPLAAAVFLMVSSSALATDLLPVKHDIYVPEEAACKGASNADMVNYWGGRSSIGVAQATCTIKTLSSRGSLYTYTDQCRDVQSGALIAGEPKVLRIASPGAFELAGIRYRYCGPRVQF